MSNNEDARKARARELDAHIAKPFGVPAAEGGGDAAREHAEMLPGESPLHYVERRTREIEQIKQKKAHAAPPTEGDGGGGACPPG